MVNGHSNGNSFLTNRKVSFYIILWYLLSFSYVFMFLTRVFLCILFLQETTASDEGTIRMIISQRNLFLWFISFFLKNESIFTITYFPFLKKSYQVKLTQRIDHLVGNHYFLSLSHTITHTIWVNKMNHLLKKWVSRQIKTIAYKLR